MRVNVLIAVSILVVGCKTEVAPLQNESPKQVTSQNSVPSPTPTPEPSVTPSPSPSPSPTPSPTPSFLSAPYVPNKLQPTWADRPECWQSQVMTNAENIGENMSAGYGCGGIVFRFYNDGRMSWDGVESGTALIGPNCVETFFTALNAVPQGEVTAATLDADGHLQSMTVHRFNQATQSFYPLGTYSCTWWP